MNDASANDAGANDTHARRRVVVIAPVPPLRGGIAHHSDELVQALRRVGATVDVVSYARIYPRLLFPGRSELAPGASGGAGVLVPHRPHTWLRARAAIERAAPDLVVAAYWHSWLAAPLAALLVGRRSVLVAHNARSHDRPALDAVAWSLLRPVVDDVIVHAAADVATLKDRGFAHVTALAHAPYHRFHTTATKADARRRLGLAADDEIALCFGLVRRYKGVDVAARAVALASRPRLKLYVVGESYVSRSVLDGWLGELGGRAVHVDRYIADDDVGLWFRAADVVLAPYHAASQSGVAQIARALGVPVIATDVGALAESADEVVPLGDVAALASAIERRLAIPARAPAAPSTSRAAWDAYARALLSLPARR